jgi:hypothetical protein
MAKMPYCYRIIPKNYVENTKGFGSSNSFFIGMEKCHLSPLAAILEAFQKAHNQTNVREVNIFECVIIEKTYVFENGLGSIIYVLLVDSDKIYIGSSYYYND